MDFSNKSYKDLQQLCKKYQIKAIGSQQILIQRLTDYLHSSNTDKKQADSFIDEITKGVEELDSKYIRQEIDSRKVYYKREETKMIFNLAICFTDYIRNNEYRCRTLYPIITDYHSKVKNCSFLLERKLLFLNAICSLFFREIEENKEENTPDEVIDELLDGGRQTLKECGFLK